VSPSSTRSRRRHEHPRLRAAQNALLWLGIIVLALFPFPGWW